MVFWHSPIFNCSSVLNPCLTCSKTYTYGGQKCHLWKLWRTEIFSFKIYNAIFSEKIYIACKYMYFYKLSFIPVVPYPYINLLHILLVQMPVKHACMIHDRIPVRIWMLQLRPHTLQRSKSFNLQPNISSATPMPAKTRTDVFANHYFPVQHLTAADLIFHICDNCRTHIICGVTESPSFFTLSLTSQLACYHLPAHSHHCPHLQPVSSLALFTWLLLLQMKPLLNLLLSTERHQFHNGVLLFTFYLYS